MARDPLETVLRLRQRIVDEARLLLAQALTAEEAAEVVARAAERSIEAEAERAADPDGGDDLVEAYAAWLPTARQRAAASRAEQERLRVDVDCRRAELAVSRSGLEAIETLLQHKRDAAARQKAQAAQRAVDEAAARTTGRHPSLSVRDGTSPG